MKYAVTGRQMKAIDQDTIQRIGIPSVVLMERAALAVADAAEALAAGRYEKQEEAPYPETGIGRKEGRRQRSFSGRRPVKIVAVCGTGNNGADGIAAGRILWGRGYEVSLVLAGDPEHGTEEYRLQRRIAQELGILMKPAAELRLEGGEIILDALFGIGLGRNVEGEYRCLIERLAQQENVDVVAVDIPSGIHADTGAVMGTALRARVTVTFGYVKSGLLLYPGREYAGRISVEDIGFSECSLRRAGWDAAVPEHEDLRHLPRRPMDSNKGTFGKLLVIAGSAGMCGAAYLSALAAYRTGTGLVKILTVPENRAVLQTLLPEAIVEVIRPPEMAALSGMYCEKEEKSGSVGDRAGVRQPEDQESRQQAEGREYCQAVRTQCDWADAIVIGPGLGREPYVESLVETVLTAAKVPVVADADALNAIAHIPRLEKLLAGRTVVTPHMGEMARLTGRTMKELKADRLKAAREYAARIRAVCVLKDSSTVTADAEGHAWINTSGCSAMAKGGSGDVLAGVIGSLLAQGMGQALAAALGVYLHGLTGERAAETQGDEAVLARDLANALRYV